MFKFKGISSNDMQVIVEEEEEFIARAAHKYEQIDVDGRDGAEFNELGYSVVERPIRVQCLNVDKVDEILAWLNGEGEFEYKGRKTIARFYSELEPKRSSWIRIIDTTFIRDPFWYKANEEYLLVKDDKNNNVSGESIHIEDSSNARCEIEIGGNHQQDTREGYNQFKITSTQTQSAGVTITKIDESSVSYQGTTTGMFAHMLVEYDGKGLEITKQMYLKAFGNLTNAILSVKLIKNGKTESSYLRVSPDLILSAGDVLQQIYVQQQNTGILISGTLQVLLTDYENKDKPYEQYGASPSLNCPSKIKTVGSIKNILDMSNAKNGASAGIICTTNADGSYKYKGTATSQYINVWFMGGYATDLPTLFTLEPGTYYINDVSLFEGTTGFANDSSKKIWTFTRAYNVTGVRAPNAVFGNTYDETKYPIIAKIDHEIPWASYNYGSVQVSVQNKNYLANITQSSITENGITVTYDGEKFLCKGTITATYFGLIKQTNIYLPIGTYTFSQNAISQGRLLLRLYYRDGTFSTYYISQNTWKASFTILKEAVAFRIMCDSLSSGINIDYTVYVQLENGKTNTDWIKPEIQQRIFPVQQEMLEGDTFVRQDGKWYEKHNYKKIMLDGINYGCGYVFPNGNFKLKNISKDEQVSDAKKIKDWAVTEDDAVFCTHLKSTNVYAIQKLNSNGITNTTDCGLLLKLDDASEETNTWTQETILAKLKELYEAGTPVIIYYKLAEPTMLECTEAQSKVLDEIYNKAHTYKNITNISAESAEVNPIINVEYLVETNEKIINDGNYISRPILRLEKTKYNDVELTINDIRFKYHFEQDKYVEIDCEQKSVKCDGIDRYRQIEIDYKFPKLNLRENNIIMHLGDCKIKVLRKDRWL